MMGTSKAGIVTAALVLAISGSAVRADAIVLRGSSIPLQSVEILDIRSGRLYYDGPVGRRQSRDLTEVVRISFDDFAALDEAERALEAGDEAQGLLKLLQALLGSDDDMELLWTRIRLVRFHKAREEFTQAASHAAAVFAVRPNDSYWRYLEPMGEVGRPSHPAANETLAALREAERKPLHRELRSSVQRMRKAIEPVAQELAGSWKGETLREGESLSGYPVQAIRRGRLVYQMNEPPVDLADDDSGEETVAGDDSAAPAPSTGERAARDQPAPEETPIGDRAEQRDAGADAAAATDSPDSIEALLQEGLHEQALAVCERVADRLGDRSVSLFLYQYGRALAGSGKPRDAAVMFMRCAILHDDSSWAPSCLVETGLIYRDVYRKPQTARRLLERAQAMAGSQGDTEIAQRARAALEDLDGQE